MNLSENIKHFRIKKGLTQEQLAERLSVSSYAVSKWETSGTYPDGALLVPLANELGVSLDILFGNNAVSVSDISTEIINLLSQSEECEKFGIARTICWQVEKGLYGVNKENSFDELSESSKESYIFTDYGFTVVSNGKTPFFFLYEDPKDGFIGFGENTDELNDIFAALSSKATMRALMFLLGKSMWYVFDALLLAKECNISEDELDEVINDLLFLKSVEYKEIILNGKPQKLYTFNPNRKIFALLLMANKLMYDGDYKLQKHNRSNAFIK